MFGEFAFVIAEARDPGLGPSAGERMAPSASIISSIVLTIGETQGTDLTVAAIQLGWV